MKPQKILLSFLIPAMMLILASGVSAMNGNGNGNGSGNGSGGGKNSMSKESSGHTPGDMITDIPLSDLSEQEAEALLYSYAEESLAHDLYMYFYELYGQQTFLNIASSEAEHQDAVLSLIERYNLEMPQGYGELEDEFEALKAQGEQGLKQALEVGVQIEMLDIEDIAQTILMTDNDDFKIIFTNIGGASYNHLRGFVKALDKKGFSTELSYEDYVSDEEIASGAFIKDKMAEKVILAGGELPESVSSDALRAQCDEEGQEKQEYSSQVLDLKDKYNSFVREKYSLTINNLSQDAQLIAGERIDELLYEGQNELLTALLLILKDMLSEAGLGV